MFLYGLLTLPAFAPVPGPDTPGQLIVLAVISAVICGVYLLHRRYPLAVLGAMLVFAAVQLLVDPLAGLLMPDVMLALAVYNVATRFHWQISVPAAVVTAAWVPVGAHALMDVGWLSVGDVGLLIVVVGWVWTWGTLVRIRRDHVASLQDRARQLERERASLARVAVAEERARIAREIHDIVSHGLGVVVVLSDGAASKVKSEPDQAERAMLTVRDTGRSALAEMRRMLEVLREEEPGSRAPQPGAAQLPELIERSAATGLPVTLRVEGDPVALPAGADLAAYRIVQEALTNVQRHAGPVTKVEVLLRYRHGDLEVAVRDDGRGDNGSPVSGLPGHGLLGMRERVVAYNGQLRTGNRPGGGFTVKARLPIGDDDEEER